jgi:hypothetical protein
VIHNASQIPLFATLHSVVMGSLNPAVDLPTSLMLESILYGIFLITFFGCLQRLLWKKGDWKPVCDINFRWLFVVIVLFASCSINLALELITIVQTFSQDLDVGQEDQHWQSVLLASRT